MIVARLRQKSRPPAVDRRIIPSLRPISCRAVDCRIIDQARGVIKASTDLIENLPGALGKASGPAGFVADERNLRRFALLARLRFQSTLAAIARTDSMDGVMAFGSQPLRQFRRHRGGGRSNVLRCGLSQRCRLRRCRLRRCRLNGRWARLRGEPRAFERQR